MNEDDKQKLKQLLYEMSTMVKSSLIDEEYLWKAVVSAAHQAYSGGDSIWAIDLLGKVPQGYYTLEIEVHMEEDDVFASQAYELAQWLTRDNIVHIGFTDEEKQNVRNV